MSTSNHQQFSKYCGFKQPDRRSIESKKVQLQSYEDHGQALKVNIRYVCIYNSENSRLDKAQIQYNHDTLNDAFNCRNTTELQMVPQNELYPFHDLIGNCSIEFVWNGLVDYYEHKFPINTISDAIDVAGSSKGYLNIFFADLQHEILGAAYLESNTAIVDFATVGSLSHPGMYGTLYGCGKTLIHEIGHCLSLVHTFHDNYCDGFKPYDDIPEQIKPNYNTEIIAESNGVYTCKNDNRYIDRYHNTNTESCLFFDTQQSTDNSTVSNEMGINYMDYGNDQVSIMFSKCQVNDMRQYILRSPELFHIDESDETEVEPNTCIEVSITADDNESNFGFLFYILLLIFLIVCTVFAYYIFLKPTVAVRIKTL